MTQDILIRNGTVMDGTGAPAVRAEVMVRENRIEDVGSFPDVTVFDPKTVKNCASFEDPHRFSEGIEYVLINGKPVLERGTYRAKALAGTVIKRS